MTEVVQQLVNGVSLGSTYALLALGLAILFSILGLVNFAHGELITLSAYTMLLLSTVGASWAWIVLGGLAGGTLAALAMDRLAFRPVRSASPVTMMLTSFGLSIIIQSLLQTFVSSRARAVPPPAWLSTPVEVFGVRIDSLNLITIGTTAVTLALLTTVLRRTSLGRSMRAAAEDFPAARLMGIRANRVVAIAFAVSGLLAAIAAIFIVARRGAVDPLMGQGPLLMAFVATVIGGFGRLGGAVFGGIALGLVEVVLRTSLPQSLSGFTLGFVFILVVIVMVVRPAGLFAARSATRV